MKSAMRASRVKLPDKFPPGLSMARYGDDLPCLACRLNHIPPSDSAPPIRWITVGASPRNRIDSTALTIGPR